MTTQAPPCGSTKVLYPCVTGGYLYFLLIPPTEEGLKLLEGIGNSTPNSELVAFRLRTDQKAPDIFIDMIERDGKSLGLSAWQISRMLAKKLDGLHWQPEV